MKKSGIFYFVLFTLCVSSTKTFAQAKNEKPKTIITTDGEVDDVDSFIRMLLYANEFDIVGLVYSSSQWHYSGDGKGTKFISEMPSTRDRYGERTELRWPGTTWMEEYIGKYAQVYPNLTQHAEGYPTPEHLLSLVRVGNIEFEGEMEKDTDGSDFIKEILLDKDQNPVYLQIWGGTNTVARALKSIEDEYKSQPNWPEIYKKVSEKAIIYAVLDQDATYVNYVAPNWPDIKVMYNSDQFWSFAYLWPRVVPEQLKPYLEGPWFKEHIKYNHGPLLDAYYLWGDGQQLAGDPEHTHGNLEEAQKRNRKPYDFISEGDSPAYFFLLDVGLRSMEDASYGGWGGRMVQSKENPNRWEDGKHVTDFNHFTEKEDPTFPQTRWIDVLQNDFAARADWCVKRYEEANHPPVVSLNHERDLIVIPGQKLKLSGNAIDPDKDEVSFHWWHYLEAGSFKKKVTAEDAFKSEVTIEIPEDAKSGETIHFLLQVSDNSENPFTRYQRVILTVK